MIVTESSLGQQCGPQRGWPPPRPLLMAAPPRDCHRALCEAVPAVTAPPARTYRVPNLHIKVGSHRPRPRGQREGRGRDCRDAMMSLQLFWGGVQPTGACLGVSEPPGMPLPPFPPSTPHTDPRHFNRSLQCGSGLLGNKDCGREWALCPRVRLHAPPPRSFHAEAVLRAFCSHDSIISWRE